MTIGEKIKHLRQKNNITQEKLAEYLNITYQSISKWENNNAMPDISLVVPLANFFGVSIDELFDRDSDVQAEEIEEYDQKDQTFSNKGYISERIDLWREAVQKYPRNYHCLISLAHALWSTLSSGEFEGVREQNAKEVVSICERILIDCTNNKERNQALQLLVFTYCKKTLSIGNEEKAVEFANMAGNLYLSRELLITHAYFTEEGKKHAKKQRHRNNLDFMDLLCSNILHSTIDMKTPEEKIFACETVAKLWNTLIYDGNFLFYHCRMSSIHRVLARNYAELKNRDKTLENLKLALFHSHKTDTHPSGEQNYTSSFVSQTSSNKDTFRKNYTETDVQLTLDHMKHSRYDFLRNDPEFVELTKSEN